MRHMTIKDVARLAGVSVTTASRALNGLPGVRPETRRLVLETCRKTGFHANLLARSLSSKRTGVIGAILPGIDDPFHAALFLHAETCAREQDYQIMLCIQRPGAPGIDDVFRFLISQRVDGILLSSSDACAPAVLERYRSQVPSVLLGACADGTPSLRVNSVSVDNYRGGYMAAEYLCRLGHREVVYLGRRLGNEAHALRHRGFLDAAGALGARVRTVENTAGSSTVEIGCQLARTLLDRPFPFTAVFAASDVVALGIMKAADELGISIPGELSLIGFDNTDIAALPKIQLTTVSQRIDALAASAVRLLLDRFEADDDTELIHRQLTPELVERDTCAAPGRLSQPQNPAI